MNLIKPVAEFMTKDLITVNPEDNLLAVKEIFEKHNIHHIPVVRYTHIVGIVSQVDFKSFLHGFNHNEREDLVENVRLRACKVEDIMTSKLAKVAPEDPIRTVVDVLLTNRIHALPVVDGDNLVGIITTYDILKILASEPIQLEDYR